MKYEAILYDFDGTLADSVPWIMESFKAAYEVVLGRCERTDEDLKSYIGLPLIQTFEMHDDETRDKLFYEYLRQNEKFLRGNKIELFPGVIEELKKLKKAGVRQGIVTSKRAESLQISLDAMELNDFFEIVVTKESTKEHKPSGAPLIYAASKLKIDDLSSILYVGDAKGDIMCAKNAGCASCMVSWSEMPMDEIMKLQPDYLIKEMSELSCII